MTEDSIALSVKRRRLTLNEDKTVKYASKSRSYKRKKRILHLPDEILYLIFSKLSIIDIASVISVVCKRFEAVAVNKLNITFCNIHNQIEKIRENTIQSVVATHTEENIIFTYKMLNILDVLQDQYNLIRATIWRYAYFQLAPREYALALRAGMLLDQFYVVLNYLMGEQVLFNYLPAIPNTVLVLKDLSKEYLDKFEKYISNTLQNTPNKSGCKIIDLLDCFYGVDRKVITQNCENNICNLTITYKVDRAWFSVLLLNNTCEPHAEIYEDIRFMCKRLRRLVRAHNSVFFEQKLTYHRSSSARYSFDSIRPNFEMYCGYGEMCDKFYFYGTMTEGYLVQRLARGVNIRDDNDDIDDDNDGNGNQFFFDVERENVVLVPPNEITKPKLIFEISVTCPLYLAPWFILNKYNSSGDLNMLTAVKTVQSSTDITKVDDVESRFAMNSTDVFNMSLIITSNTAKENRLPFKYKYSIIQTPDNVTITGEDIGRII